MLGLWREGGEGWGREVDSLAGKGEHSQNVDLAREVIK